MSRFEKTGRLPRVVFRRGATLIDVAMGSMLLSVILIPTMQLIRENERTHRERALRETMLFEAERSIEEQKIWLASQSGATTNFQRLMLGGSQQSNQIVQPTDGPPLQSQTSIQRDTSLGGATGLNVQLVTISTVVWQDRNGNGRVDADEPSEQLSTQWTQP